MVLIDRLRLALGAGDLDDIHDDFEKLSGDEREEFAFDTTRITKN